MRAARKAPSQANTHPTSNDATPMTRTCRLVSAASTVETSWTTRLFSVTPRKRAISMGSEWFGSRAIRRATRPRSRNAEAFRNLKTMIPMKPGVSFGARRRFGRAHEGAEFRTYNPGANP